MIFLAPGIVILSQVFGVTGMLWAAPAADVLGIRTDRDTGRAGMAFHSHPGESVGDIEAGNKTASGVWNAGCVSGR